MRKLADFHVFICTKDAYCVAITETWLNSTISYSLFIDTSRCRVFRNDRCSISGGVCLLLKNNLRLAVSTVIIPSEFASFELLAVNIHDSACLPFRLVVAYRPPGFRSSENALFFSALTWIAAG